MTEETPERKISEIQATSDPMIDSEVPSAIAPQGYDAEFVEDIAHFETPEEKRKKAIRYFIWTFIFLLCLIYFCVPRNSEELPNNVDIPYGLEARPLPPTDKFLYQVIPTTLGNFEMVNQQTQQLFDEPFVGATALISTYINPQGTVATVWVINAESYINTKRYLRGLKTYLAEEAHATHIVDFIWQEHNFLEWDAPNLADRAYGFAWSNKHFYYSVNSSSKEARDFFAENFPY